MSARRRARRATDAFERVAEDAADAGGVRLAASAIAPIGDAVGECLADRGVAASAATSPSGVAQCEHVAGRRRDVLQSHRSDATQRNATVLVFPRVGP